MVVRGDKILRVCDNVIEAGFYVLMVAVTFSNSIVEIASATVILAWVFRIIITKDLKPLNILPAWILLLHLVWVLLSCFNSGYAEESFRGVFKTLQYSSLFLVMATFSWPRRAVRRFVNVLCVSCVVICSNGIYQYFFGRGLIRGRTLIKDDYLRRISSSFVHPNDFGAYLMVVSLILLSFVFLKRDVIKRKIFICACFLVSAGALYLTKSRGAWLSFIPGFFMLGALKAKRVLVLFLLFFAALGVFMPYSVRDRMTGVYDPDSGTTWERLKLWEGTIEMIKVHPVLGFGVNTYSRNFPDYKPADYPDHRYAHNCYLQMASEIGVPGMLLFVSFILSVLIGSFFGVLREADPEKRALGAGLIAGLSGFFINSSVDTHLFSLTLAVFFHVLMGFCYSLFTDRERIISSRSPAR